MVLISKSVELTIHLHQPTLVRCEQCGSPFVALARADIKESASYHAGLFAYPFMPKSDAMSAKVVEKLGPRVEKAIETPDALKIRAHCPTCRYPYPTRKDPKVLSPNARRDMAITWGVLGAIAGLVLWWLAHFDPWAIGLAAAAGIAFGAAFGPQLDAGTRDKPLNPKEKLLDGMPVETWSSSLASDAGTVAWASRVYGASEKGHVIYPLPPRSLLDDPASVDAV